MQLKDNIDTIVDKNSSAYLSLVAFREAAKRFFGIDKLPLIQTQDVKRELKKLQDAGNASDQLKIYPFAYFSIQRIGIVRDHVATKTISRSGRGFSLDEIENSLIKKAYLFPSQITVELHYVTNDIIRAIDFSTRALLVAATGKMNSRVEQDGASWIVGIEFSDYAIDIPRADKELEEDPEGFDLALNCIINTNLGVMRPVAKINNRGEVTVNVGEK